MDDNRPDKRREATSETGPGSDLPDHEEVARRAYRRFEERGGQHGDDQADWFEAEREVRRSSGGVETERVDDHREQPVTSGRPTRGKGTPGAALDEDSARSSGTGPTSSPTGTGPGGSVRTPGTAVSGGPTEGGR